MKQPTAQQSTRRTVLQTLGVGGLTVGLTGVGTAQPDHDRGRGTDGRRGEATQPDHHDFECPDGMDHLGTFELVTIEDADGELLDCYFEQDDGEFHITITGYDTKDGEACEPIVVSDESDSHNVEQVASFGGTDSHVDDEPEDGVCESDLETNGGQQAAISLLHFCGTERGDDDGTDNDSGDGDDADDFE